MVRHREPGLTPKPLDDVDAIARIIENARGRGFHGFSGRCGHAAVAIRRALFDGRGEIVGAFNAAFYAAGYPIGHVAVLCDDVHWDSDAEPKDEDDITSWGMLDPEDPDHIALATSLGIAWSEEIAEAFVRITLTEDEALALFEPCDLETMIHHLTQARQTDAARP